MSDDFKAKIREFLKEKNPYMLEHEIEDKIPGLWSRYRTGNTPELDYWLRKRSAQSTIEHMQEKLGESLNWNHVATVITNEFPVYYDKSNMWWLWNNARKCYELTDETDIANIVDEASKRNTLKGGVKAEMLEAFRRVGRKKKPKEIPLTWVQYKDKIVNIDNQEEIEPSPEYFLTNPIPHNLGLSDETPIIDALLKDWAGEYSLTLKQIIAYCTIRDYPIHRIFLLIGSGSNGKGTYLRLINRFLGNENVASVEMDLIVANQFHVTKLHNRLVCQMSETNFGTLKNTSMLKKLSGGDLIGFEYKNKLPFDAYNYAKLLIATNSLPSTHDKTDGFYRRWMIIEFSQQFGEKRDVLAEIPEVEYENLARWSCKALQGILRDRSFDREGSIAERKERYETKSNPLRAFLQANYESDLSEEVPAGTFFDDFSKYLSNHGMRALTYNVVRSMMKDEGYEYSRKRFPFLGENPVASIVGLKAKAVSVSDVSVVSALSVSTLSRGTNPDVLTPLTQNYNSIIDEVRELYKGRYEGQPIPSEIITMKVPRATEEWLKEAEFKGEIFQPTPGWFKPL